MLAQLIKHGPGIIGPLISSASHALLGRQGQHHVLARIQQMLYLVTLSGNVFVLSINHMRYMRMLQQMEQIIPASFVQQILATLLELAYAPNQI